MRTEGSAVALEFRRRLAVQRVGDGYSIGNVADFVGVDRRTVRRWVAAFRQHGAAGLAAHPVPGWPPKLTPTQEKIVCRWLADNPTEHVICLCKDLSASAPSPEAGRRHSAPPLASRRRRGRCPGESPDPGRAEPGLKRRERPESPSSTCLNWPSGFGGWFAVFLCY